MSSKILNSASFKRYVGSNGIGVICNFPEYEIGTSTKDVKGICSVTIDSSVLIDSVIVNLATIPKLENHLLHSNILGSFSMHHRRYCLHSKAGNDNEYLLKYTNEILPLFDLLHIFSSLPADKNPNNRNVFIIRDDEDYSEIFVSDKRVPYPIRTNYIIQTKAYTATMSDFLSFLQSYFLSVHKIKDVKLLKSSKEGQQKIARPTKKKPIKKKDK